MWAVLASFDGAWFWLPALARCLQSPKKVGDDIQAATKDWKGIKVMVKITVLNRQAEVEVLPSTAALVLQALGAFRDRKKVKNPVHDGNITMENVLEIARTMRVSSQAREFSGTVKEVLGTCFSIGCSVNGEHPKTVQAQIDAGTITVGDA
jgi:large subunit ribosomal protein L12e